MIRKTALLWVLVFLGSTGYAAIEPGPFTSFFEFIRALEELPGEEFVKRADETPSVRIVEYHRRLEELDPRNFERWNQKLRLIHAPGFASSPNHWELRTKGPSVTIGFLPEARPTGFGSMGDLYNSIRQDDPSCFRTRLALTEPEDLNRWLQLMSEANPGLFQTAMLKATVVQVIGFHQNPRYRIPGASQAPATPMGFGRSGEIENETPRIRSQRDFIAAFDASTPEEFQRLLRALPENRAKQLLGSIQSRNPKLYQRMVEKLQSRTRIGFSNVSGDDIIAQNATPAEGRSPIGFSFPSKTCADLLKPEP